MIETVRTRGLDTADAAARLVRDGPNALDSHRRGGAMRAVLRVLTEPMLLLLAVAAALYAWVGEWLDATAMIASVSFVVLLNLYQNVRSERALDALRDLTAPKARVVRDGEVRVVAADTLVVGDVLVVAQGDRVAADASLVASSGIEVDESLLTGESVPVRKEHASLLYAGTFVVQGEGIAEIVATGSRTEFGRLGLSLASVRRADSPLRGQITRLVRIFAPLSLAGAAVLTAVALARGVDWHEAVLGSLAFALATVPEEFPVILSVLFALGAWRLARIDALVQRPDAIETLGCMSVLCTDKTGTLTENRMRVEQVLAAGDGFAHAPAAARAREEILSAAAFACPERAIDPMDIAVLEAAGVDVSVPRLARFYPFSNQLHATAGAVLSAGRVQLFCKGAPELLAELCSLGPAQREALERDIATMAAAGFRVLGVGSADLPAAAGLPDDLRSVAFDWRGLLALADPLRADVPAAVRRARDAGVRVLLVTGDHPATARAIAQAAGIAADGDLISGQQISDAPAAELARRSLSCNVYARVRPADKLKLVQGLVDAGEVVGMTGDGINDAPALAAAHVGIAMGKRGSDVARHAASVVLADDRFATIVDAIALGRAIYANLLRAVQYVAAVHVPIAAVALLPVLAGLPPVLLPVHVVLLELLIDPASTLVFERRAGAPGLMRQPPRPLTASLLTWAIGRTSLALGLAALAAALATYALAVRAGFDASAVPAYVFVSILGGNLASLVVTAWPAAGGAGRFSGIATALVVAPLVIAGAAMLELPARLLHLEALAPLPALLAASVPALVVCATGFALARRRRAVS